MLPWHFCSLYKQNISGSWCCCIAVLTSTYSCCYLFLHRHRSTVFNLIKEMLVTRVWDQNSFWDLLEGARMRGKDTCPTFFFGTSEVLLFEVLKNVSDKPHSYHHSALVVFQLLNQSTHFRVSFRFLAMFDNLVSSTCFGNGACSAKH